MKLLFDNYLTIKKSRATTNAKKGFDIHKFYGLKYYNVLRYRHALQVAITLTTKKSKFEIRFYFAGKKSLKYYFSNPTFKTETKYE